MKRDEIWWADLPAPVRRRPVLLLSRHRAYSVLNTVTVAFLTTAIRNIPVEVPLGPPDGLPKACVVNLDVANTTPKSALTQKICTLSVLKLIDVAKAARFAMDL